MLLCFVVPPEHGWTAVVEGIGDSLTHEQGAGLPSWRSMGSGQDGGCEGAPVLPTL